MFQKITNFPKWIFLFLSIEFLVFPQTCAQINPAEPIHPLFPLKQSLISASNQSNTCSDPSLSFSQTVVDRLVSDGSFTQTATSLNVSTPIVYSGNNPGVATVNSSTGQVTLLNAGTVVITASQAAGTYNSLIYCSSTTSYTLNLGINSPVLSLLEITQPSFSAYTGNSCYQTVQVAGSNLTGNLSANITGIDSSLFTVQPAVLNNNSGMVLPSWLTIAYTPFSQGSHWAILNLSSLGALPLSINLSGTATWMPLIAPIATQATNITANGFTANWEAVSGAVSYQLNVFTQGNSPVNGSPFVVNTNSKSLMGLAANTMYYYTVIAQNEHTISPTSNLIQASTLTTAIGETSSEFLFVLVNDGHLEVHAHKGDLISLYVPSGQKIAEMTAVEGINIFPLAHHGIFIVKCGSKVIRIIE